MGTAAIVLVVALIVTMAYGLEITWSLGLACIIAVLLDPDLTFIIISQRIFANSNNFSILVISTFTLAGDIMSKGGLSKRLVISAGSLAGWIPGGISLVSVVACTFFAAISGPSIATTTAVGGLVYPEMSKRGYPEDYSAVIQTIGDTLEIVIPSSIVLVAYGNITGTPVGGLLITGVIPRVICCIFLCIYTYYKTKRYKFPGAKKFSFKRFLHFFRGAIQALVIPVIILGGIYAGIFTLTESMVIAVMYGALVCLFICREVTFKSIRKIIQSATVGATNLMVLVVTTRMFGWLVTHYKIPQFVTRFMLSYVSAKYMFWGIIILLLIVRGIFLGVGATNLILAPVLAPIAAVFGIDPVHSGLVFIFLLATGQAMPSFGTCLFVSRGISKQSAGVVSRQIAPFMLVEIMCGVLLTVVPILSTLLPNLVSG